MVFGVSEELASNMGCRIRLRALINLEKPEEARLTPPSVPGEQTWRPLVSDSPVVDLQERQVGLAGDLFLLVLRRVWVLQRRAGVSVSDPGGVGDGG